MIWLDLIYTCIRLNDLEQVSNCSKGFDLVLGANSCVLIPLQPSNYNHIITEVLLVTLCDVTSYHMNVLLSCYLLLVNLLR
jgi:hypothetical protein